MDSGSVNLVVKAANQQFEDLAIACEESWNIKRLKEHLSKVYPCKPCIEEQKLIYSGQLLEDKIILKDVLRHYDDPQPQVHTFHLVYTPKTRQQFQKSSSSIPSRTTDSTINDGLRQRNVQRNVNNIEARSQQNVGPNSIPQMANSSIGNCPISGPSNLNAPAFGFQPPNEYVMAQQLAMQSWMQQAYIQYMNQYMNLLSVGVRPETVFMQNQATSSHQSAGNPQMPYLSHNFLFTNMNLPQNTPFTNINLPQNTPENVSPPPPVAAGSQIPTTATAQAPVPPAVAEPAQNPQPQPQPRFPNIVQEELPENRDWLDMFYALSRLMVLITLVYFYSSPLRCLVVLFIGLAIYLYHIGFFRSQTPQANEANNNVARGADAQRQLPNEPVNNGPQNIPNNNAAVGDAAPQIAIEENNTARTAENSVASNVIPEEENNRTSVIAFVKTFVVSFFVSLLPGPAEL